MPTVFLCLFFAVSLLHLFGSFIDNRRIRNATKGAVLLCLLGYYLTSAAVPRPWFAAALALSLLGDVLLIFKGGFAAGGFSFLLSHVCLIVVYAGALRACAPPWYFFIAAAAYAAGIFFEARAIFPRLPDKLHAPTLVYFGANASMNLTALLLLANDPCTATALIYSGAVLFFISDCLLFFVRFCPGVHIPRKHFPVMLTYIAGVLLITLGVLRLR
ncbi:MAG: lysoplasmalogenase family protein [Oscillospiraceae bacterium]|nr:lysoplasmalogenase family protein [Oscillospiraceae bacterium]